MSWRLPLWSPRASSRHLRLQSRARARAHDTRDRTRTRTRTHTTRTPPSPARDCAATPGSAARPLHRRCDDSYSTTIAPIIAFYSMDFRTVSCCSRGTLCAPEGGTRAHQVIFNLAAASGRHKIPYKLSGALPKPWVGEHP